MNEAGKYESAVSLSEKKFKFLFISWVSVDTSEITDTIKTNVKLRMIEWNITIVYRNIHSEWVCAESTGGIFCGVVFFFYKTKESHVLYIFFITRTTKEKDGGGKSCGIISVLVLAIRGQTLSCCQHRPRNYDYNNITVLSPSLKSLFFQLFSPLVDPPVRSFLSRRVSWKAEP